MCLPDRGPEAPAHLLPLSHESVSFEDIDMADLPIRLTCADYARVMPLAAGEVKPDGIALTMLLGREGSWPMRAEMLRRAAERSDGAWRRVVDGRTSAPDRQGRPQPGRAAGVPAAQLHRARSVCAQGRTGEDAGAICTASASGCTTGWPAARSGTGISCASSACSPRSCNGASARSMSRTSPTMSIRCRMACMPHRRDARCPRC